MLVFFLLTVLIWDKFSLGIALFALFVPVYLVSSESSWVPVCKVMFCRGTIRGGWQPCEVTSPLNLFTLWNRHVDFFKLGVFYCCLFVNWDEVQKVSSEKRRLPSFDSLNCFYSDPPNFFLISLVKSISSDSVVLVTFDWVENLHKFRWRYYMISF